MRIVFICTGNTCRSPMAEGLARLILGSGIEVESAGLAAWEGDCASDQAIQVFKEKGIDLISHKARPVSRDILAQADWIIPMTRAHAIQLMGAFPEFSSKIKRLGAWGTQEKNFDVRDPWGGSVEIYRKCAKEIETLLYKVKADLDLLQKNEENLF